MLLQLRKPPVERLTAGMIVLAANAATAAAVDCLNAATHRRRFHERRLPVAYAVQIAHAGQLVVAARAWAHVLRSRTCRQTVAEAVLDAGAHAATFVQSVAELATEFACDAPGKVSIVMYIMRLNVEQI